MLQVMLSRLWTRSQQRPFNKLGHRGNMLLLQNKKRLLAYLIDFSLLTLVGFAFGTVFFAQTVCRENQGPGILDRVIIIPIDHFSFKSVEDLGLQFEKENKEKVLYMLTIVVRKEDCFLSHDGKLHAIPEKAIEWLNEKGLPETPIVQIIGIKKSVVLRFFDKNILREKVLLGDKDPTIFVSSGSKYQLLHFRISKSQQPIKDPYFL
jgi:hypothetical protein